MLSQGFIGEEIELSSGRVSFDLAIPTGMVIFDEPLTKQGEATVIETLYFLLNSFNVAHVILRLGSSVA